MALAYLHVGQAGLQIAEPLWSLAREHPSATTWLFDDASRAHCLLIDCEPRVVRSVARSLRGLVRDDATHVLRAHGSANNWAMGFGSIGEESLDAISDSLRRMIERMDWWAGTVVAHSLAGGTGSGLGSRLLLDVRDAYPKRWLLSAAVLPFASGDSALQHYNAALALAHVQEHADLALLFENQALLGIHERLDKAGRLGATLSPARPRPLASMRDLNEQIALALGGALFPLDDGAGRPRASDVGELVAAVCPMPSLKLAQAHTVCAHAGRRGLEGQLRRADSGSAVGARPARRHMPIGSWESLSGQLCEQLPRFHSASTPTVTLCAHAAVRGTTSVGAAAACARLERVLGPSPCSPFSVDWRFAPSQGSSHGVEQSISLVANRTSVEALLSTTLRRAGAQLDAGAYVHHYARYGCTDVVLRGYVDACWQIVADYRQAQAWARHSQAPRLRLAQSAQARQQGPAPRR
jgi:hypothetical protein